MDGMSITSLDDASKSTGGAKTLTKALGIINLLTVEPKLRLVEITEGLGIPRPTGLRLLDVLRDEGVVSLDRDGNYRLGPRVAVWGQTYLDQLDIREHGALVMNDLSSDTRETCFLGVRDDLQILYVAKVDGPHAIRPAARVGGRNPLHCTAIGKSLLAFAGEETLQRAMSAPLPRKTDNTITSPKALADELDKVRTQGFAFDNIENEEGVRCIAAPIRNHENAVVAAVSVSAPAYRLSMQQARRTAPKVIAAADEISRRLGSNRISDQGDANDSSRRTRRSSKGRR